ncbi:MAG: VanZ family protein [Candidatus Sumerlaeia bacterium]|nr:VanZ family protein [Candidatus Sumerlaeia bacterium]
MPTRPRPAFHRPAPRRFQRFFLLLSGLWIATVLFLNNQPGSVFKTPRVYLLPHIDKFAHFLFYGIMAALLWRATVPGPGEFRRPPVRRPALFVLLVPALVGAIDEINQLFIVGRSADWGDWLTDVAGAGFVVAMGVLMYGRRSEKGGVQKGGA